MSFKHCVLIFIFSNERWSQTWWGSLRSVISCNKASDFDDITLAWKDGSWLAVKCESGYCHFKQLVLWKWRTSPIFFFVFFMNFLLLWHLLLAKEWIYLVLVWYQHSESFSNEIFWSALDNGQWTADTRRYHSYQGSMHWPNSHLLKSIFTSCSRVSVFPSFDCWLNGTSWREGLLPKNLVPYLPAPSKIPLE